jgi:hypothetical protein
MSTIRGPVAQSKAEVRTHVFDYTLDLLDGVTIASAAGVLTKPDNSTSAEVATVVSPLVMIKIGPLSQAGQYLLDCNATCSDGEILNVRLVINVDY